MCSLDPLVDLRSVPPAFAGFLHVKHPAVLDACQEPQIQRQAVPNLPALCFVRQGWQPVSWVDAARRVSGRPCVAAGPAGLLSVCPAGLSFRLTSALLLSILVFLPSVIVVVLLLVRMGRKFGVLKEKKKSGCKKSSIEVSDE